MKVQSAQSLSNRTYSEFDRINGEHPFKDSVPEGVVQYQVRTRSGGKVAFFNFPLAKEMGLLPSDHPEAMNEALERKLLETFSLVIINEYDIHAKIQYAAKDIRPNLYMATRYLQLQHPNKQGRTSGDGRGIWNGEFKGKGGRAWDVTSSGTGATCLSPAAAKEGRWFKSGDRKVCYGNGYNTFDEGMAAALMSEIFYQNGIRTERTLLIVGFSGKEAGTTINVRAGLNLMRPSHFFCHLKQGNYANLKSIVDLYYDRQVRNLDWPKSFTGEKKYRFLTEEVARAFAMSAAKFESDYVFCWMDWDGDNILADGGIIDYGSVRQFGMFYGDYRYDDDDRFSTSLPEQKFKARYIVQSFAQIRDFLVTGKKKNIRRFRKDPAVKLFDAEFERVYRELLLEKVGFSPKHRKWLIDNRKDLVVSFRKCFNYFERVRCSKGIYSVGDGVNRDPVFCMRDLLREFPKRLHALDGAGEVPSKDFVSLMATSYARSRDLKITPFRENRISEFQSLYSKMITEISGQPMASSQSRALVVELGMRASVINRKERITGDAAIAITECFNRERKNLNRHTLIQAFQEIVAHQRFRPEGKQRPAQGAAERSSRPSKAENLVMRNLRVIRKYCESL